MTRPTLQRRTGPSPKMARVIQAGTDIETAMRLLDRGAEATPMGGKTILRVPGEQFAVTLPTEAVEMAKRRAKEMDAMFGNAPQRPVDEAGSR